MAEVGERRSGYERLGLGPYRLSLGLLIAPRADSQRAASAITRSEPPTFPSRPAETRPSRHVLVLLRRGYQQLRHLLLPPEAGACSIHQ